MNLSNLSTVSIVAPLNRRNRGLRMWRNRGLRMWRDRGLRTWRDRGLRTWRDCRGLSTVEYVVILLLVAVGALGCWSIFGRTLQGQVKASVLQLRSMGLKTK